MNELTKRILVAVIGIPPAVVVMYFGGLSFAIVIAILSAFALWEFYKIGEIKKLYPKKRTGIIAHLLLASFFYFFFINSIPVEGGIAISVTLVLFALFVLASLLLSKKDNAYLSFAVTVGGIIYVTLPFCILIIIREFYRQEWLLSALTASSNLNAKYNSIFEGINNAWCGWFVFSMFVSLWIGDTFAYFFGKKFGRHKLFPAVSPKKTWEGSIFGFIGSIIAFTIPAMILIPKFPLIHIIIISLIIGVFGQIGDLAESKLKRDAGIKDSSNILPGHGGFLDRFDSLFFVIPLIYIYLVLIIFI